MSSIKRFLITLAGVISALFVSIFGIQKKKVEKQKEEIKELKGIEEVRKVQMETLKEVQHEIKESIEQKPKPKKVEKPKCGDSASYLERLNKLHKL